VEDIEIWRDVPSTNGIKASNLGRVLLPEATSITPTGGVRTHKTKPRLGSLRKSFKTARHLYRGFSTRTHGTIKVHRMVCEAFHGPPTKEKPIVIHLDEDGTNNHYTNLKWGTQKENLNMPKFIAYCKSRTGSNNPNVKGRLKKGII
tara:strand:+ start:100 stop:540 length:441 start_codon:yes stop_codon:yes gene_type:complete